MTQQQLAEQLGIAQQTLAHYKVGRARLPVSMLPVLARLLMLSLHEVMGQGIQPAATGAALRGATKRGPVSRLHQQIAAVEQLLKPKPQFAAWSTQATYRVCDARGKEGTKGKA